MDQDPLQQAFAHHSAGRLEAAALSYRAVLARDPDHTEANHLLGVIRFQQGHTGEARTHLARATAAAAATAEMHNNFGVVLNALGESEAAAAAFSRALGLNPDYAEACNNLGSIHRIAGRIEMAVQCFRQALALKPDYAEAQENLRAAYRDVIPAWHFAMMNDEIRNRAYDEAIGRAAPGKRVLDIGTGAGLLAMMAARAGAQQVTTVEMVSLIAERARDIVAANNLSDRIRVIGKPSSEPRCWSPRPSPRACSMRACCPPSSMRTSICCCPAPPSSRPPLRPWAISPAATCSGKSCSSTAPPGSISACSTISRRPRSGSISIASRTRFCRRTWSSSASTWRSGAFPWAAAASPSRRPDPASPSASRNG